MAACLLGVLLAAAARGLAPGPGEQGAPAPEAGPGGLKVLRYVSLKADRVFLRQGPGTDYPIAWVFQRAGLPVEVLREFEVWRQVRDAGGTVGWVHGSLLSGRRTALVLPWEVKEGQSQAPLATLRDDDHETGARRGAGGGRRAGQHHRLREAAGAAFRSATTAATSSRPSSGEPIPTRTIK